MNTRYNIEEMGDEEFIGMDKKDAMALCEKKLLKARITAEDGEFFIVTMDYRIDRINFNISNNIVVGCKRG